MATESKGKSQPVSTLSEELGLTRLALLHPEWPEVNENGDIRCPDPSCREYVNRKCWRCGWERKGDGA